MTKPADKKKSQASKIAPKPNRIIKTNSPEHEAELKALRGNDSLQTNNSQGAT